MQSNDDTSSKEKVLMELALFLMQRTNCTPETAGILAAAAVHEGVWVTVGQVAVSKYGKESGEVDAIASFLGSQQRRAKTFVNTWRRDLPAWYRNAPAVVRMQWLSDLRKVKSDVAEQGDGADVGAETDDQDLPTEFL